MLRFKRTGNACRGRGRVSRPGALLLAASLPAMLMSPASAEDMFRFGSASNSVIIAPIMLADVDPAIMGKHGLRIKITDFQGKSANCIAALISNSVDVCAVGTTTGTDAIAEGADLKAIAAFAGPINEVVLSAKTVAKLGVSPKASVEDRLKAMKGLRIISAAPGSAHYTTLDKMLKGVGLSIKDLKYQSLGDTVAMMQAIRNDQVDGAMWSAGSLGGLIAEGVGVRWIATSRGDVPAIGILPYNVIYAQTAWVEKNPELVARFQAGFADAIAKLKAEPAESSKKIKARYFPELDDVIWKDGFEQALMAFLDGGKIPRVGWESFIELQAQSTGKDYSRAAFDKVVVPAAQRN